MKARWSVAQGALAVCALSLGACEGPLPTDAGALFDAPSTLIDVAATDVAERDIGGDALIATDAGSMGGCTAFASGRTVGTTLCGPSAQPGYTLFSPIGSLATYLIDLDGRLVHQWSHTLPPGQVVYLLSDGRLLRTTDLGAGIVAAGGQGGGVELIAWDGTVEWSFRYFDEEVRSHHDVAWLPSGNVVLIAWERVSGADATAIGRRAAMGAGELWPDHLIEVHPEADGGASIVWEWHAWDHLLQRNDPALPNYGEPSAHPEPC